MRRLTCLLALAAVGSSCANRQRVPSWTEVRGTPDARATRQLAQGTLIGFTEPQGNLAWLGIPYTQPPVGPLRWKAPRTPLPWQGAREATTFGPLCPQLNGPLAASASSTDATGSEDCLTLNVFTPAFSPEEAAREKRPVMFWIHGGGNTIGTSNVYGIARNFALKHGEVVVSVNYRLGVLGWFHHPSLIDPNASPEDNSGNYGTLDLIEGLRWVSTNIAAFGGDPANVTVFGESAPAAGRADRRRAGAARVGRPHHGLGGPLRGDARPFSPLHWKRGHLDPGARGPGGGEVRGALTEDQALR